MKRLLFTALTALASIAFAQPIQQIYDHDSSDLWQLHNMPFDESRLLVTSGFASSVAPNSYYELSNGQLNQMTFTGVDQVYGPPVGFETKMFFVGESAASGREFAFYDGTSTVLLDINSGPDGSTPIMTVDDGELVFTAKTGAERQLFRYNGGFSVSQISQESGFNCSMFLGKRGNSYYFLTKSQTNPTDPFRVKVAVDNGGSFAITELGPLAYASGISRPIVQNGNFFFVNRHDYVGSQPSEVGVYEIDANDNLTMIHQEQVTGNFGARLIAHDGKVCYYKTMTQSGSAEILELTGQGTYSVYASVDPMTYGEITGHISHAGKTLLVTANYALELTNGSVNPITNSTGGILRSEPAEIEGSKVYLYETPFQVGVAKLHVIDLSSMTATANDIIQNGVYTFSDGAAEFNNGTLKFLFRDDNSGTITSDIYEFAPNVGLTGVQGNDISVFPNPVINDVLRIRGIDGEDFQVFDSSGRLVYQTTAIGDEFQVNVSSWKSGMYVLRVGEYTKNLIIE